MAALTDFGEAKLLDRIFLQTAFTQPTSYNLALYNVSPSDDGTGGLEISNLGYSRKTVAADSSIWARTGNVISNNGSLPQILVGPASENWFTVTAMGLFIGSDLFLRQSLSAPISVTNGNNFRLIAGALSYTLQGVLTDWARGKILDWLFLGATLEWPTFFSIALASTTPTASAAGVELSGGAYARKVVTAAGANWTRTNSTMRNSGDIIWDPASVAWLDVVGIDIYDHLANRWFYLVGDAPEPVDIGEQFRIRANNLQISAS